MGVAGRDSPDAMADFVARHGLEGIDHLVAGDGSLWARFEVLAQPAWVFVEMTERLGGCRARSTRMGSAPSCRPWPPPDAGALWHGR